MPENRTVYVFAQERAGDAGGSPPDDTRPRAYASSSGKRSDSSARSEFANAVRRRYREEELEPIQCLLCGETEGLKSFDSCHLVPFDATLDEFVACGLGNRTDGRNGVPMCGDCHHAFDTGLWGFDSATEYADKIVLRVHVTEGLRQYGEAWSSRHAQTRTVPKGVRWPSVDVWRSSWKHNFRRQESARHANPKKRCAKCGRVYKTEKGYMKHDCTPHVGAVVMPSPRQHWPPREAMQSQYRGDAGAGAAGPPLLASLSPRTPRGQSLGGEPPMAATQFSHGGRGSRARGRGRGRR